MWSAVDRRNTRKRHLYRCLFFFIFVMGEDIDIRLKVSHLNEILFKDSKILLMYTTKYSDYTFPGGNV